MKIKAFVFLGLVSTPFMASAENCVELAKTNPSIVEVLECFQQGLDSQQKRIAELEKENQRLKALEPTVQGMIGDAEVLPPNLIRNAYMNLLNSKAPAGYSEEGNITLEAVHPFTKGFEGPYTVTSQEP